MNNDLKKIIIIFLLISGCFLFYKWFFNQPCLPPEKPERLTSKAVWFGSCDGGNWIELININLKENKYRFKIYRDYDGVLMMDANFKVVNCEDTDILNENNWKDLIVGYLNENIGIKESDCYLKIVKSYLDEVDKE